MSIKQFDQELAKGLAAPIYLLTSPEEYLLYEAIARIKEHYRDASDFNFDIFDLKSPEKTVPAEEIITTLNTLPFLSERRVVMVRNMQKLSKKEAKKFQDYLLSPSASSLLVMLFEGASQKLFDPAALKGVKVIPLLLNEKELPFWIKTNAERKGIRLTDQAVEYLLSWVGSDLGMLHSEIEKIACAVLNESAKKGSSGLPRVDREEVKEVVYAGVEYSAFDLVDALRRRDARKVFRIFEHLNRGQEAQMLLGALNYQYTRSSDYAHPQNLPKRKSADNEVFALLHEADICLKRSCNFVMEDLLVKLLKR